MTALLLRRLIAAIPTLFVVAVLSFLLMKAAPGGPFDGERALSSETQAALAEAYALDAPLPTQFVHYLARLIRGDFGPSLVYRDFSVTDLIWHGLPISLLLGSGALLLALMIGVPLGAAAAWRGGLLDHVVSVAASGVNAIPSFVSAPLLVLLFGLQLGWLPVSGLGAEGLDLSHLFLPIVALSLPTAGAVTKLMRAGLREVLTSDFVRTARARGLHPVHILRRHALRPALIPVVSYMGPAAAGLLTGAVVIETVFALPGLGRYFVQGALNRDYPLVMAVVLLYAGLILLFNLLADLAYGWLDPRVRG